MSLNISEFIGNFKHGGARSNLFRAEITNPVDSAGDSQFQFLCSAATIPSSTINKIETHYQGRVLPYAGNRTFEDWTVSILNDEDFKIRNSLEAWNNYINAYQGNDRKFSTGDPSEYMSTGKIYQLSKSGDVLREYQFFGLFPIDISSMQMDWSSDEIEKFDVTFAYQYFEVVGGVTGNAGGA